MDPTERQEIILDTIEELADDLVGLMAAHEESDIDIETSYLDHHLWNVPPGLIGIFEDWLRLEIEDRRKQWGLAPTEH